MALTMVVLPTPGPPVITKTLDDSASRTAAFWLSARFKPVRCSTQELPCPRRSKAREACAWPE